MAFDARSGVEVAGGPHHAYKRHRTGVVEGAGVRPEFEPEQGGRPNSPYVVAELRTCDMG